MGRFYQNNHRPDSALYYYRKACRRMNIRNIDLIVPVIKNMSECFAAITAGGQCLCLFEQV